MSTLLFVYNLGSCVRSRRHCLRPLNFARGREDQCLPWNPMKHLASVAPSSTSRRNKGSHNELSLDGSDADNDSWHGEYDNGWDDGHQTPNYRRSVKRPPKSISGPKAGHQPDNGSGTPQAFKKPRMNSSMSSVSREYYPATTSLSTRPADDFCEEPPLIYSSARGKPSTHPPMSDAPMEFRLQPSTAATAPPPQTKSRQGDLVGARPISKMAGHSPKTPTILTSPNAVHVSRATLDNACINLTRSPACLPVRICTAPDFGPPQFCFYGLYLIPLTGRALSYTGLCVCFSSHTHLLPL
ncbi:hypothetical protein AAHC03_016365 [Spirometra sp. Aus1]